MCSDHSRTAFFANIIVVMGLLLSIGLFGCDDTVLHPGRPDVPFSMYGVLSPDRDTQSVQLYVHEPLLTAGVPDLRTITLSSTNLDSGEMRMWSDTVFVDPSGEPAAVFWAPFRPEFDTEYRIEVVRLSDDAMSFADVRIPPPVTVRLDEESAPLLDVIIEGEAIRVHRPTAEYFVSPVCETCDQLQFLFEYYHGTEEAMPNGWRVTLNMIVDYEWIRGIMGAPNVCSQTVKLDTLKLHMLVGDAAWDPPGAAFDANVLANPHAMSNVQNGLGFIGGGYDWTVSLLPSREAVEKACFIYTWD